MGKECLFWSHLDKHFSACDSRQKLARCFYCNQKQVFRMFFSSSWNKDSHHLLFLHLEWSTVNQGGSYLVTRPFRKSANGAGCQRGTVLRNMPQQYSIGVAAWLLRGQCQLQQRVSTLEFWCAWLTVQQQESRERSWLQRGKLGKQAVLVTKH